MDWVRLIVLIVAILGGTAAVLGLIFYLMIFVIGCNEKIPVFSFVEEQDVAISTYIQAMMNRAHELGFRRLAKGHHVKYGHQIVAVVMIAQDAKTLAMISEGQILRLPSKRTILLSQFTDKSILRTDDETGLPEFDPKTARQLLLNASFDELFAMHTHVLGDRLAFPPDGTWKAVDDLSRQSTDRIVEAGWAKYTDPEHKYFRHSPLAAARILIHMYRMSNNSQLQDRIWIKRPDTLCPDCGYDIRETPHRCPECGREYPRALRRGWRKRMMRS